VALPKEALRSIDTDDFLQRAAPPQLRTHDRHQSRTKPSLSARQVPCPVGPLSGAGEIVLYWDDCFSAALLGSVSLPSKYPAMVPRSPITGAIWLLL
jgi:hypothetical protein